LLKEAAERKDRESQAGQATPEQIRKQKEEEEQMRKDSDFENAIGLFGGGKSTTTGIELKDESEASYIGLAKQVGTLVQSHQSSEHYPAFLKYDYYIIIILLYYYIIIIL
jgi:hypothetical protein